MLLVLNGTLSSRGFSGLMYAERVVPFPLLLGGRAAELTLLYSREHTGQKAH